MWILKLKIRHDCIIGKRCLAFECTSLGYPLDSYTYNKKTYYLHLETLYGDKENIKQFIADLKKDIHVNNMEVHGNSIFFSYQSTHKNMPSQAYTKLVFHTKPVVVDSHGVETWEVASWNRENINQFIEHIRRSTKGLELFRIIKIEKSNLFGIHFPQILPNLSPNQKKAFELARAHGYYDYPHKIKLGDLAKLMKISLSTFREHLRRAEHKMLSK